MYTHTHTVSHNCFERIVSVPCFFTHLHITPFTYHVMLNNVDPSTLPNTEDTA